MQAEFTDRYSATGTPTPNGWTVCKGHCEGMGVYPMPMDEWERMPSRERPHICPQRDENDEWDFPPADGYLFVWCEDCGGTGRRVSGRLGHALDVLHTFYFPPRMFVFAFQQRAFFAEAGYPQGKWSHVIPRAFALFRSMRREQKVQRQLLRKS